MLHYLLFAFYFFILAYAMVKSRFVLSTGFSKSTILLLFIVKIAAGIAIGWISATYYSQGNDYWTLQRESAFETRLLLNDPSRFFTDILNSPYDDKYGGFFNSVGSYWNDLKNNVIIKILAILNLLSRENYYINSLFLNSFCFLGTVALAKVFLAESGNRLVVIGGCFLIPSTLYFSSGIHKDLFVFSMLGFLVYSFYYLLKRFDLRLLFVLFISAIFLLLMRNIVLLLLIPPSVFLWLNRKYQLSLMKAALISFGGTLIAAIMLHFTPADPLKMIVQKQKDFADLGTAYSQLPLNKLEPTLGSFLNNTPQALNHAFLRPYLWEYPGHFLMFTAIELFICLLLTALAFFKNPKMFIDPFYIFCFVFAFTMVLTAGYIVPNTGSLVRYRSLYLPFLLVPIFISLFKKYSYNK